MQETHEKMLLDILQTPRTLRLLTTREMAKVSKVINQLHNWSALLKRKVVRFAVLQVSWRTAVRAREANPRETNTRNIRGTVRKLDA